MEKRIITAALPWPCCHSSNKKVLVSYRIVIIMLTRCSKSGAESFTDLCSVVFYLCVNVNKDSGDLKK